LSRWAHNEINRPIGNGMLIGGALAGVVIAVPTIAAAFRSLRRIDLKSGQAEELPLKFLYVGVALSFLVLLTAAYYTALIGLWRALSVAVVGTLWARPCRHHRGPGDRHDRLVAHQLSGTRSCRRERR
jgi:hypothetical protein